MTHPQALPAESVDTLLPCPFCGGEASDAGHTSYSRPLTDTWWQDGSPVTETFQCACIKCGATTRSGIVGGYQTRAQATTAWNTRTHPAESGTTSAGEGVMQAMTVADVLDRAADRIEPEGAWGQGEYKSIAGRFCVLGALAYVAGVNPNDPWTGHLASDARYELAEVLPVACHEVSDWNDAPERTQPEVVAKLREAAALAREQGL